MLARKFKYDIFSEIRLLYWGDQAIIKRKIANQEDFSKISIEIPGRFLKIPRPDSAAYSQQTQS